MSRIKYNQNEIKKKNETHTFEPGHFLIKGEGYVYQPRF